MGFPPRESCIVLEEEKDGTFDEPIEGYKDPSAFLVDEYCISFILVHELSSYALSTTTITHEDDNWVEGFFLLVTHEE